MQLPDLSNLPPWALVIFAVSLAVIFATIHYGRQQGGKTDKDGAGSRSVELAALTLDSSAVKQVAAAVEALNLSLIELNRIAKDHQNDLDDRLQEATREISELRKEIRTQGEAIRK